MSEKQRKQDPQPGFEYEIAPQINAFPGKHRLDKMPEYRPALYQQGECVHLIADGQIFLDAHGLARLPEKAAISFHMGENGGKPGAKKLF